MWWCQQRPSDGTYHSLELSIKSDGAVSFCSLGFDVGAVVLDAGASVSLLRFETKARGCTAGCGNNAGIVPILRPLSMPTKVLIRSVSAGELHVLALDESGHVYGWGSNDDGQLGCGGGLGSNRREHSMQRLELPFRMRRIAAGGRHSAGLSCDHGQCWTWGSNLHGQCGTGKAEEVQDPCQVDCLGPLACRDIACGLFHTVCCVESGDVYTWGSNMDGSLGRGESASCSPGLVGEISSHVVQVASGARHTVVLCQGGNAYSFGNNMFGQLGVSNCSRLFTPVQIPLDNVAQVSCGWWHSCFLVSSSPPFPPH